MTAASGPATDQRRAQRGGRVTWPVPAGDRQPGGDDRSLVRPRTPAADAGPDGRRLAPHPPPGRPGRPLSQRWPGRGIVPARARTASMPAPAAPHPGTTSTRPRPSVSGSAPRLPSQPALAAPPRRPGPAWTGRIRTGLTAARDRPGTRSCAGSCAEPCGTPQPGRGQAHSAAGTAPRPAPRPGPARAPVGFQNSATGLDLGFYAARWYSPSRPPRTPAVLSRRQDQEDSHGLGGWLRLARCPVSRDRGPGSGQGPSPRLFSRDARPVRAPAPRHRSQGAGLSPSRRPGTSWKLRNLRRWLFFLALAQYPANASSPVIPGINGLDWFRQRRTPRSCRVLTPAVDAWSVAGSPLCSARGTVSQFHHSPGPGTLAR